MADPQVTPNPNGGPVEIAISFGYKNRADYRIRLCAEDGKVLEEVADDVNFDASAAPWYSIATPPGDLAGKYLVWRGHIATTAAGVQAWSVRLIVRQDDEVLLTVEQSGTFQSATTYWYELEFV